MGWGITTLPCMNHTIAALATPPGTSALAVIRISGAEVPAIIRQFLGIQPKARQMHRAYFKDSSGQLIDDVLACFFPGPHSYTGEDLLELFPHGNMVLVRKILHELYKYPNVMAAGPGEFTRRAFENGKLDLVQAEAVGQLIHATNTATLQNAQKLLAGDLSIQVQDLIDQIKYLSAKMELDVDFSEEEADPDYASWQLDIQGIQDLLLKLLNNWERHSKLQETPRVALCGKPNAGKSSLINALIQEDRLLVSAQAGTTRDWIEVPLYLEGGEILLIDTAGFGEAVDELDALSQEKSKKRIASADFVIWIEDGTSTPQRPDFEVDLVVRTRADSEAFMQEDALGVSSLDQSGLKALKRELESKLLQREDDLTELWMGSERQAQSIRIALDLIQNCLQRIQNSEGAEVLAFELREARLAVEEITGEIAVDEILGKIFSGFCIGK